MGRIPGLAAALIVAGPATADDDHRYRLLVADAEAPQVRIVDVGAEGAPVAFDLA